MKTDRKILINGRAVSLITAIDEAISVRIDCRNNYEQLVTRCAIIAERAEILDKLLKESTDQDWQE